ncbi:VOC family protein [Telluria beijingensis]|uniref:VOC family protein n=1 Tax=Telluria beijingensis TaxID=3068633 RepID=UPI002795DC83|nr:VOC family protein [Massilia sp. REN29]
MLTNMDAIATVGVRDIAAAKEFYENVLGLSPVDIGEDMPEVLIYRSGNTRVMVYQSEYAGTNRATAITWDVGDQFSEIVAALQAKGARFEHYDMDGMRREGDVHIADKMKIVWLKDPDGNILNINGT